MQAAQCPKQIGSCFLFPSCYMNIPSSHPLTFDVEHRLEEVEELF